MKKKPKKIRGAMFQSGFKVIFILSVIIVILMFIASIGGLLAGGLYQDNLQVRSAWLGNDLITLFLALPLLIASLVYSRKGSQRWQLVWFGMLLYTLYNYAFYLFGAAFNSFFLIYVALFTLALFALLLGLPYLDVRGVAAEFKASTPVIWLSGYMGLVSIILGVFHVVISLDYVFTGQIPEIVINVGHPTNLIAALDLSLVVSFGFLGAIWLWLKQPWGYVLALIWNVKGGVYTTALTSSTLWAFFAGASDSFVQIGLWLPIAAGCFISSYVLLKNMKSS